MTYDLIIVGGGPAGAAAGVYAARKKIKTLIITADKSGQSVVSPEIQNWIGEIKIGGEELSKKLWQHVEAYASDILTIKPSTKVIKTEKTEAGFLLTTESGETLEAKSVLITTGGRRRRLEVPGAAEFDQKGLTYCASCDGPMFTDKDVVVIGGGNAGLESAAQLLAYAKTVFLIHRHQEFKGDQITVEKLLKNPKFHAILNAEPVEVKGDKFVTSLVYRDLDSDELKDLPVSGIFIEIGFLPNTEMVKDLVTLTSTGAIITDAKNQRASVAGVWAAGDCTDGLYHQNNIAAGDAVKAVEDIYQWLHKN